MSSVEGTGTLFWGIVFGAFGVGYFIYGRKQKRFVPLFCGIGLMGMLACAKVFQPRNPADAR